MVVGEIKGAEINETLHIKFYNISHRHFTFNVIRKIYSKFRYSVMVKVLVTWLKEQKQMIECENCILEKVAHVCEVDCLALEDALREHDKQIRADTIEEVTDELLKLPKIFVDYFDYIAVARITKKLEQLKEQNIK